MIYTLQKETDFGMSAHDQMIHCLADVDTSALLFLSLFNCIFLHIIPVSTVER